MMNERELGLGDNVLISGFASPWWRCAKIILLGESDHRLRAGPHFDNRENGSPVSFFFQLYLPQYPTVLLAAAQKYPDVLHHWTCAQGVGCCYALRRCQGLDCTHLTEPRSKSTPSGRQVVVFELDRWQIAEA